MNVDFPGNEFGNFAQDEANVAAQIGVVHGDATVYQVNSEDPPARRYEVGVNYLRAGVYEQAEELICEAVMRGHCDSDAAYYWMLAILGGRSWEHLTAEDVEKLRQAADLVIGGPADQWRDGAAVITGLINVLAAQSDGRVEIKERDAVLVGYQALPQPRIEEIRRHLDAVLKATIEDADEAAEINDARRNRTAGWRKERVPLFFQADPAPPKIGVRRTPGRDPSAEWAKVVIGLGFAAIGLLPGWYFAFNGNGPVTLIASGLIVLGAVLTLNVWPQWAFERLRHREFLRTRRWGEQPWPPARPEMNAEFYEQISALIRSVFGSHSPGDAGGAQQWRMASHAMKVRMAEELTWVYGPEDVEAAQLRWLIRHHAAAAADRWRWTGLVDVAVPPPAQGLTLRVVLFSGVGCVGLTLLTAPIFAISLCTAPLLLGMMLGGLAFAQSGAGQVFFRRRKFALEVEELHRRYREELTRFHQWKEYLDMYRPTDEEMGRWLDYDLRHLKALAQREYGLAGRDVIADVVLTEPGRGCQKARYVFGPPRYSLYHVTIILLTDRGVRQWSTDLNFTTTVERNETHQSFRYDAIAIARLTESGFMKHRMADGGDGDTLEQHSHKRLRRRALSVSLVGGVEAIEISVEDFSESFTDRREHDDNQLFNLAADSSGVTSALRILEAVAAEGKDWIVSQQQRRRRHARLYAAGEPLNVVPQRLPA